MTDDDKPQRMKIGKPALRGFWDSSEMFANDPEADELLRECSRLQSRLNRGLRPSDILQLMRRLGWRKEAPPADAKI